MSFPSCGLLALGQLEGAEQKVRKRRTVIKSAMEKPIGEAIEFAGAEILRAKRGFPQ
jgi:hypothetical protein